MTLIILIACTITLISGATLIGLDYASNNHGTTKSKPRKTKANLRLPTGRINSKGFNALRRRGAKDSSVSADKKSTRRTEKSK